MKIKNILKRIAAVCLCTAVMLSVASCGGSPASTPSDDSGEEVSLHLLEVNNNYFRNFTQAVKNSVPDMPLNIEYYSGPATSVKSWQAASRRISSISATRHQSNFSRSICWIFQAMTF